MIYCFIHKYTRISAEHIAQKKEKIVFFKDNYRQA